MTRTARRLRRIGAYLRRLDVATLRAAAWAGIELRQIRAALPEHGLDIRPSPPPDLPAHAIRGVALIVRIAHANCLERSLLLQGWLASQGEPRTVLVGVAPQDGHSMRAHAWIRGYEDDPAGYTVISSVSPAPNLLLKGR